MEPREGFSRRKLLIGGAALAASGSSLTGKARAQARPGTIDDFFRDATDDWVRRNPGLATRTHYFSGEEGDRLARQLTPQTREAALDRIARARRILADLRKFDRSRMNELQRVSADLLDWQLDIIVKEEPYLDYFRARRLVVDTGLHAMKWTRQQGIDYGIEVSEVERYAVYPGQAFSYMMGELKIIECREKAKKALGARFSLREYHSQALTLGTVPLEMLEREVDSWIRKQA